MYSPPTDLPARETGILFEHRAQDGTDGHADGHAADAVVDYDLVPTADLEHIDGFTGPQLSFEFAIPGFAEDAVAEHITTATAPWTGVRYDALAEDITDPGHRRALSDRYDAIGNPSPLGTVVAGITNAVTAAEAPEGEGLTTAASPIETVALLESDAEAVPTFRGVLALRDVPEGEHALTVNGAGVAPHSETVAVEVGGEADPTVAGVDGEIPLVARENAVRLGIDPREADTDLTDLADVAGETRAEVAAVADDADGSANAVRGLARALAAVAEAARRAADSAGAGDRAAADQRLETVATRLETVSARLSEASDGLPPALVRATEHRLGQARRRTEQARAAERL